MFLDEYELILYICFFPYEGLIEQNIPAPKICEPGLIRREYEAERKRIEEEAHKRQELEAQASAKLIKELQVYFYFCCFCFKFWNKTFT